MSFCEHLTKASGIVLSLSVCLTSSLMPQLPNVLPLINLLCVACSLGGIPRQGLPQVPTWPLSTLSSLASTQMVEGEN